MASRIELYDLIHLIEKNQAILSKLLTGKPDGIIYISTKGKYSSQIVDSLSLETVEGPDINIDLDKNGKIVGIEILGDLPSKPD